MFNNPEIREECELPMPHQFSMYPIQVETPVKSEPEEEVDDDESQAPPVRKSRRRERNRVAAQKSRDKKKRYIIDLEASIVDMRRENKELRRLLEKSNAVHGAINNTSQQFQAPHYMANSIGHVDVPASLLPPQFSHAQQSLENDEPIYPFSHKDESIWGSESSSPCVFSPTHQSLGFN